MAAPGSGIGYRTACDVLMEVSYHLLQPVVFTSVVSVAVGSGGFGGGGFGGGGAGSVITVASTYAMYPGCEVVIGWNTVNAEVVTVQTVSDSTHFTADLLNPHSPGETVLGPTFPIQVDTDPIFTQPEMLGYLARAQNEFLTAVPCYYQRFFQNVNAGILYQNTPSTTLLIDRIAASTINFPISSLSRVAGIVTLASVVPHGLSQYSTFGIANPNSDLTNTSFLGGAFAVLSAPTPTTLTYRQVGSDASAVGGNIQSMLRLYEVTQEELSMQDRYWKSNWTGALKSWFEDRTGLYRWGVGGIPSTTFPAELLCAVRDTDTLDLLDQFLVPDMCIHYVKYLALSFCYSKDGVMQSPQMADFCMKRYTQGVMATQRYINAMQTPEMIGQQQ